MTITRKTAAPKEISREDIARWEARRPALKAINDATMDKSHGFAITVSECVRLCGSEADFRKIAAHWKTSVLWVLGITVEYEHKAKAYVFVTAAHQLTTRHARVMAASEKKHRQEWQRLGVMRNADLTDHERALRLFAMDQHAQVAGKIEAAREHHRIALTRPESLPRV